MLRALHDVPFESEKQALGGCGTFFDAHSRGISLDSFGFKSRKLGDRKDIVALALTLARAMQATHYKPWELG